MNEELCQAHANRLTSIEKVLNETSHNTTEIRDVLLGKMKDGKWSAGVLAKTDRNTKFINSIIGIIVAVVTACAVVYANYADMIIQVVKYGRFARRNFRTSART